MLTKKEPIKNEAKNNKAPKLPEQQTKRTATAEARTNKPASPAKQPTYPAANSEPKKGQQKTRVTVKYDAGFHNQLYIRGKGANLTWEKGETLRNVKADEWVWETDVNFSHCEFKILINDRDYETGNNHYLNQGATITYTPRF